MKYKYIYIIKLYQLRPHSISTLYTYGSLSALAKYYILLDGNPSPKFAIYWGKQITPFTCI